MIGGLIAAFKVSTFAVKALSMLKYASPAIAALSFAKDYVLKHWKISLIAVLAAALIAGSWLHNRETARLELRIVHHETVAKNYIHAHDVNVKALKLCYRVNNENTARFIRAQVEGNNAVRRLEQQLIEQTAQVEKIDEDIIEYRGKDEGCRSLDDPLPDWFDDWLRE